MKTRKELRLLVLLSLFSFIFIACGSDKTSLTSSPTKASGEISEAEASTFVASDAQVIAAQLLDSVDGSVTGDITSDLGDVPSDTTKTRTVKALLKKIEEGKCQTDDNDNNDNDDSDDNDDNDDDTQDGASDDNSDNEEESSACTYTITEGSETDADCDGIPAHIVAQFDCDFKEETYSFTTSGKFTITDKDDASVAGGYTFIIEDYTYTYDYTYTANGTSQTYHYTGESEGTFDNSVNNGTYHTEYDFGYTFTSSLEGGSSYSYTGGYFMNLDYVPEADGNDYPYDAGTISTLKGFYKYEFDSDGAEAQGKVNYTLAIEAKDLVHPSTACSSYYQSGTLSFTDGSDNEIVITYDNCTYHWSYNGKQMN